MSLICPKPASTAQNVSSGYWSTTAKTSLPNGLASSHDCAGTFTSSTQRGSRRRKWTGQACSGASIEFFGSCRRTSRFVGHLRRLTVQIDELAGQITSRTAVLAPSLFAIPG